MPNNTLMSFNFSPEDSTRTDTDFLIKCVQMAVDCGATIINIPDTVGYSYPNEYGRIFKTLIENINSKQDITYSAHCHDDLEWQLLIVWLLLKMVPNESKEQ